MKANRKRSPLFISIILIIFIVLVYQLITYFFNTNANNLSFLDFKNNVYNCEFTVHYIDVGKADSSLIKCGDVDILIDAGDVDIDNKVTSYLKQQNVDDIELIIETHPDRDHIGQMTNVLNSFDVDEYMMPIVPDDVIPNSNTYNDMINTLSSKNIDIINPYPDEHINLGDVNIEILAPINIADDTNGNSIVCMVTYKNKKFLFTGDCDTAEEKDILNQGYDLKADVLKVGHHGSKSSSSVDFLKAVNPQYSVISVGPDKNNLPKQETIDKLNSIGSTIYRTDIDGTIIMGTNGDEIYVKTEK